MRKAKDTLVSIYLSTWFNSLENLNLCHSLSEPTISWTKRHF